MQAANLAPAAPINPNLKYPHGYGFVEQTSAEMDLEAYRSSVASIVASTSSFAKDPNAMQDFYSSIYGDEMPQSKRSQAIIAAATNAEAQKQYQAQQKLYEKQQSLAKAAAAPKAGVEDDEMLDMPAPGLAAPKPTPTTTEASAATPTSSASTPMEGVGGEEETVKNPRKSLLKRRTWVQMLKCSPEQTHVYVSSIAFEADESNMREVFQSCGQIIAIHMPMRKLNFNKKKDASYKQVFEQLGRHTVHKGAAIVLVCTKGPSALRMLLCLSCSFFCR